MTNEEAIEYGKEWDAALESRGDTPFSEARQFLNLAIKALETGEVYMTGVDYNLYIEGYKDGKRDFEPKQGEWVDTGSGQECNVCHEIQYGYDNFRHFCANCGAKMNGDAK